MPSQNYYEIQDAIDDTWTDPSWAIQGRYQTDDPEDDPRTFLAYVLGGDKPGQNGAEAVLGYQYAGPNTSAEPHPTPRNWRCFKLALFVNPDDPNQVLTVKKVPFDGDFDPPDPLTNAQVARQNCVEGGVPGSPQKIRRTEPYES